MHIQEGPVPESTIDTATALQRIARGPDSSAWDALLAIHGPHIKRIAQRIGGPSGLAEDIYQETLLKILVHANNFRPPKRPEESELVARGWLSRIAVNTALKMLHSGLRRQKHDAIASALKQDIGVDEAAIKNEEIDALIREVECLPSTLREPILMRYFGDLRNAELAEALSCSNAAIKKRLRRGLEQLRRRLALLGWPLSVSEISSRLSAERIDGGSAGPATKPAKSLPDPLWSATNLTWIGIAAAILIVVTLALGSLPGPTMTTAGKPSHGPGKTNCMDCHQSKPADRDVNSTRPAVIEF